MDEFVCITVLSRPGESQADFSARLSRFWTHMLRNRKTDFEKVYAETTRFSQNGDRLGRQYLARMDVIDILESEMQAAGVEFEPLDREDIFSRYEATPPDWMQIEH
ncbi:MAG TPA: hypothetical protein VGZ47_04255 [Gemmataceae bacterium]|jgi:hypothetical protein|nr:hypothetical protein [Gemmataceae bacterium]